MTWLGSMEKNDVYSLIDGQNISVKHNINKIVTDADVRKAIHCIYHDAQNKSSVPVTVLE